MIFEICEHLREQIGDINEKVLGKFQAIQLKIEEQEAEDAGPKTSNMDHLDYTPVNEETFGAWCKDFLAVLKEQEESAKTALDDRPTGKEIFMSMGGYEDIDDLTLDEDQASQINEEANDQDPDDVFLQNQGALYDKNLFAKEYGDEEDEIDFD